MTESGQPSIPKESKTKQSMILALIVHLVLFAFLWIGIRWQSEHIDAAVAEIWDIHVTDAAPQAKLPDPKPEPVIEEKPAIEEPPEAKPEVEQPKPEVKPDIALEEEKKRKEEEKKKKEAEEKKRKEEIEKKRREEEKKKKDEEEKKKQQKLAEEKKAQAILEEEERRLAAKSGTGGKGIAAQSTGNRKADASYIQKIGAKIKSNTIFYVPDGLSDNSPVEYEVELMPDGSVKGIRKQKSSSVSGFDDAVLRAIEKSAPYPQDNTGAVPSRFTLTHRPKDQN